MLISISAVRKYAGKKNPTEKCTYYIPNGSTD
jgi:hypothetical protein